jgi:hypothetical protein
MEERMAVTLIRPALASLAVLTVLAIGAVLKSAPPAWAAPDVTPVLIPGPGNKTCGELQGAGQNWSELKVDPNQNGTFSDGTLTVTITNTSNDKTFDWSSNIGVDAVFVKAGSAGSNLYVYDPPSESTGDDALTSPGAGTTNQISHIAFCYDLGAAATPTGTPTAAPATATPAPIAGTPTPTSTPALAAAASPSPTPTVLGAVALPATGGTDGDASGLAAWLLLPAAAVVGILVLSAAKIARRRLP